MKDTIFLVLSKSGVVKMVKNKPSLRPGEIPVQVDVIADDAIFEPLLKTTLEVREEDLNIVDQLTLELTRLRRSEVFENDKNKDEMI